MSRMRFSEEGLKTFLKFLLTAKLHENRKSNFDGKSIVLDKALSEEPTHHRYNWL